MIKIVGSNLYAHRSNYKELMDHLTEPQCIRLMHVTELNYDRMEHGENYVACEIIKYNLENDNISLIESPDWTIANEPTVGDSLCFKSDGTTKLIKGGSKVYHNKWQFVGFDYKGFDIKEAKQRTKVCQSIDGINKIKHLIGSKNYWNKLLLENNIEI